MCEKCKELENDIFLEDLPRKNGKCNKINWFKSLGYKVKFIYDNIKGEVEILDYDGKFLYIKYLDNKPFKISRDGFRNCQFGKLLGLITCEFKFDIGSMFKDDKRDLIITDKQYEIDKKGQNNKWYKYKCNICGYEGWIVEFALTRGDRCSVCSNHKAILGINTIWDTDRWMVDLGVSEEDAKKYTKSCGISINVICPDCGRIKDKITIAKIHDRHSISCSCGDSTSYPEKIMFSVLEQLNLDFKPQLTKSTFEWCEEYRYDFYITSINGILEVNGLQHYEESFERMGGRVKIVADEKENDKIKKELALKNGVKEDNYIVIDCRKSELEFIKESVLDSNLSIVFNLNKVDWLKAEEFALKNLVKLACEMKRDTPNMTTVDIGVIMKLSKSTITRYLKKGSLLGWCNYDAKEEIKKCGNRIAGKNKKNIEIFKDGISLGRFESCAELERQSEDLFSAKLVRSEMSYVCNGLKSQYKGYTFKYEEDKINNIS